MPTIRFEIGVATIQLIRQRTNISIPDIKAWGLAADNPLGVGPIISLEFIEGISVDEIR
jgi:hypothetical protein